MEKKEEASRMVAESSDHSGTPWWQKALAFVVGWKMIDGFFGRDTAEARLTDDSAEDDSAAAQTDQPNEVVSDGLTYIPDAQIDEDLRRRIAALDDDVDDEIDENDGYDDSPDDGWNHHWDDGAGFDGDDIDD